MALNSILFAGGIKPALFAHFLPRRFITAALVRAFQLEEKSLSVQAAAEAAEIAVFTHHAVAGNDDGRGIPAGARPGGADRERRARAFGQVAVADGFSVRDALYPAPYASLEIGAGQAQRQREAFSLSGEIFPQLLRRLAENGVSRVARPAAARGRESIAAGKIDAGQSAAVSDEREIADRALNDRIVLHVFLLPCLYTFHLGSFHLLNIAGIGGIARHFRTCILK